MNNMTEQEFDLFQATPITLDELQKRRPVVLAIDDDIHVQESMELAFGDDYELVFCTSGETGIEIVSSLISVVILDIKMQGKDGFETFIGIKHKFPHLPIIFHSAYQDLKDPFEIMNRYHPFGYISKEGDAKELSIAIANAVQYSLEFSKNEILVNQLEDINENLEEKVALRTQKIEEQTQYLENAVEKLTKQ
jgi:response regulator RpfG family c-di-GMP phosphodiesterase